VPLKDLVFSDLFVTEEAATSWYKATPDTFDASPVPVELEPELLALRQHLEGASENSAYRVDWTGIRLRVERVRIADGKVVFVCRRYRHLPDSLTSLGMPQAIAAKLLQQDLKEGLVVFLGKAGSGKTTMAASFIRERLILFGGVCWSVENPIELPLQGKHGEGWCYQIEASSDDDIGPVVRHMLRTSPNIIFIGEVRDGRAVREAIAAATSGHLVVTTFHAGDLLAGIARLSRLAENDSASAALADGLRVGLHVRLSNAEPGKTPSRILFVEPLWMSGQVAEGLRSMVRDGNFHLLKSEVERQRRNFIMGNLP
jgi:twitching motility protein PilT